MLLGYLLVLATALVILNTYPLLVSRNLVFDAKKSYMHSQIVALDASLQRLDTLEENNVYKEMEQASLDGISRLVVADYRGTILYAFQEEEMSGDTANIRTVVKRALENMDVLSVEYSEGSFISRAASPIVRDGKIEGAIFIQQNDGEQGQILLRLQQNLRAVSVAITAISICLSILFSSKVIQRITQVLDAIQVVREGNYQFRIKEKGRDELAELTREFNSLTNRLEVTEEVRRRFVSDASHELKTPLASIQLLSDSILQNADFLDKETALEFVGDIAGEAQRLSRITEKLLRLTRLDSKITPKKTVIDMKSTVEGAVDLIRPIAAGRNISLTCHFEEDCFVKAGKDDMYQIIINLCDNAIKYNKEEGAIFLTLRSDENNVQFLCEDTGIGIAEEDIPHIFERFYRVDSSRSRDVGGSGLGLSIVKSLIDEYGGTITAQRRENGGTRFIVSLPKISVSESEALADENSESQ